MRSQGLQADVITFNATIMDTFDYARAMLQPMDGEDNEIFANWRAPTRRGADQNALTALNNNLYAVGGSGLTTADPTTAERYDPDLNSWTPIASMGTRRVALGLTAL